MLVYVYDILCIHHDPMPVLKDIDNYMKLKPTSVGDPEMYPGAKLSKVKMSNGVWAWAISLSKYVQEAVNNCQQFLRNKFDDKYKLI